MKTIIAASALALMTSTSAFAWESANIGQLVGGVQDALNEIENVTAVTNTTQNAVNAANLVSKVSAGGLDSVFQFSDVDQDAENKIDSGTATGIKYFLGFPIGTYTYDIYTSIKDVSQSATNVVNSVSLGELVDADEDETTDPVAVGDADVLDIIKQKAFVDQSAMNSIDTATTVEDVTQSAVNAANLITSEVDTPELKWVKQSAVGDQTASNVLKFKTWIDANQTEEVEVDGELVDVVIPSTQDATNVANSVTLKSVSKTLLQYSDVAQDATNVAESVSYSSNVWDFEQTAVNAANLVSIGAINDALDIGQIAHADQWAMNSLTANGTVDAVVQSATNVANSIGDL